jgi:hypothetical protein
MPFDAKKFLETKFEPRTKKYPVPQLKDWFPEGEKAVWIIKSIGAADIGRADESVGNEAITDKILTALTAMNSADVVDKIKELMGKSGDKPKTIAKRIYHLMYGSVDPVCTLELAVRLCDNFPVLFLELTNEILMLSGQGFEPGKSPPSGKTQKSKSP